MDSFHNKSTVFNASYACDKQVINTLPLIKPYVRFHQWTTHVECSKIGKSFYVTNHRECNSIIAISPIVIHHRWLERGGVRRVRGQHSNCKLPSHLNDPSSLRCDVACRKNRGERHATYRNIFTPRVFSHHTPRERKENVTSKNRNDK